jgi:hypothetical protein
MSEGTFNGVEQYSSMTDDVWGVEQPYDSRHDYEPDSFDFIDDEE